MTFEAMVILGLTAAILIFILVVCIYRALQAKLSIHVSNKEIKLGQEFDAELSIKARRSFEIKFIEASIICEKKYYVPDGDGKFKSRYKTVYKSTKTLEGPFQTIRGREKNYKFTLQMPDKSPENTNSIGNVDITPFISDGIKKFVRSNLITRRTVTYQWYVVFTLETGVIDLSKKQAIYLRG